MEPEQAAPRPGDLILFYCGGVIDARDAQAECSENGCLEHLLKKHGQLRVPWAVARLEFVVRAFAGGVAPFDDVTMRTATRMQPGKERR